MKFYNNNLEIVLFSNFLPSEWSAEEITNWLTTTLQTSIEEQQRSVKKIFFTSLNNAELIYLS